MEKLQKRLDSLLEKYGVPQKARLIPPLAVVIEGETVPLLPWRCERRFIELKNFVDNKTISGISVMRTCRIEKRGADLLGMVYREADLCEWILGTTISEMHYFANGDKAINMIARMESGIVCTIEAAATLAPGAPVIDKHEIISQRGIACDRVVDTQIPQNSIYVFGEKNDVYLDVDFELYGLTVEEIAIVRQAFEAAKDGSFVEKLKESAKHLALLKERVVL